MLTLNHLNVPALEVAPSPTSAPQKAGLFSAEVGRVGDEKLNCVVAERPCVATAVDEKPAVALPVVEKRSAAVDGPEPLAKMPPTDIEMADQPTVDAQKTYPNVVIGTVAPLHHVERIAPDVKYVPVIVIVGRKKA